MDRFTGLYGGNPGGTTVAQPRDYGNLGFRRCRRRQPVGLVPPRRDRARAAGLPDRARRIRSSRQRRRQRQHLRSGHQDAVRRILVLGRLPALDRPRHGGRSPLRRQPQPATPGPTENWNARNIFENGFLDEFKRAQANLAGQRRGRPARTARGFRLPRTGHRHRRRCRPTSRTSAGRPTRRTRPRTPAHQLHQHRPGPGHLGQYEPDPVDAGERPARERDVPRQRAARRAAGELLRDEPGDRPAPTSRGRWRARRYDSLQLELRRRLSQGLLVNVNYTYAKPPGSSLQSLRLRPLLPARPTTDVPHAFKMHVVRTRCRSAAAGGSAAT